MPARDAWWYVLRLAVVVVAAACVVAAGGLAWRHHTSTPRYRLAHGTPEERQWAIRQLVGRGASEGDWREIAAAVEDPQPAVQLIAIAALGHSRNPGRAPVLAALLEPSHPMVVRLRALEALGEMGGDLARAKVRAALAAREPELRALAARCVARFGHDDALALLRPLLQDRSETVRLAAADALNDLADSAGVPAVGADVPVAAPPSPPPPGGPIVWEAERGIRIRHNIDIAPSYRELARLPQLAKSDPMFVNLDGFSGDGWIQCLEGGGGNHEWLGGESGSIDIGRVDYPISVPRTGRYVLWARMWLTDKCGDSYYAQFDRMPRRLMEHPWENVLGEWRLWFWLTDHEGPVTLEAGDHTLHVQVREDGIRIDQFYLAPESCPPPSGAVSPNLDPLAFAADDVTVALSRESDVVDGKGELHATARVLRGGSADVDGMLEIDAEDGKLDCPARLPVKLAGKGRVFAKDFTVQLAPAAPCRERLLSAKFIPAKGGEPRTNSLVITKPWPWLLAGPLRPQRSISTLLQDPAQRWRAFAPEQLFTRYATIDFENAFGNGASGCVYLKARIRCERGGAFLWLLNSDDNSRVWVDGNRAIENPRVAPAEGFLTRRRVEITPGEHVIVAAVSQASFPDGHIYHGTQNYWVFRLRIREEEHKPAPIIGLPWDQPSLNGDQWISAGSF